MPTKFEMQMEAQRELITGICDRLNFSPRQLAEVAGINPETMRKYANGYQKMGETAGILLRHVESEQQVVKDREREIPPDAPITAAYATMESDTLDRHLKEQVALLGRAGGAARRDLLGSIRAMLDELERREWRKARSRTRPASSKAPSAAATLARRAGGV